VDLGSGGRLRELVAANRLQLRDAGGNLQLWLAGPPASEPVEAVAFGSFAVPNPRRLGFDPGLDFLGGEIPRPRVAPGGELEVRTFWARTARVDRVYLEVFELRDRGGRAALTAASFLGTLLDPVHLWPEGPRARATDRIVIPGNLAPGRYTLGLDVARWDGRAVSRAQPAGSLRPRNGPPVPLGEVEVVPGAGLAGERGAP